MWEEGRWSGRRVTRLSVLLCLLLVAADVVITGAVDRTFDIGFVLLCVAMALMVRPGDFFTIGVLPPMLLLGQSAVLAVVHRSAIAAAGDGLVQAVVSGLAHHAGALLAGYGTALAVLAIRARVIGRHRGQPKRAGSPAPTRSTSGAPPVKSTTVVGSDPHGPESITASSW